MNEYNVAPKNDDMNSAPLSPKIEVKDRLIKNRRKMDNLTENKRKSNMKRFYLSYALHMSIPLYGLFVLVFQFVHLK